MDGGLKTSKISKGYDNPAPTDLLTVKIKGENLKSVSAHQLLACVVLTKVLRGQEFETTQVNKVKEEEVAYLTAASPEQSKKIITHEVIVNKERLIPINAAERVVTRKKIQRKNCLTLIVRDCNVFHSASEIATTLKKLIGEKNVVKTYFKDGNPERDHHAGTCNLEVLNPTI